MTTGSGETVSLIVDGRTVEVPSTGSLLDVLRDDVGVHTAKDGCAPQGQCGCCTVLVDGAPRVACVTPVRRVAGRTITTVETLDGASGWAEAFCATGASQCGFCTPGIIVRLAALDAKKPDAGHGEVEQALLAHLCRCTGWRTVLDAWDAHHAGVTSPDAGRDLAAASRRATIEGGAPQVVSADVALGHGGFADDTAPVQSLVAILDPDGQWTLGESVAAARAAAGTIQGRRTTADATAPIALPDGDWALTLQTSWVEPGYLETDTSWAEPSGDPAPPLANGGAFGAKVDTDVAQAAHDLATERGRTVRTRYRREDSVRRGPKRPPLAAGLRADGSGVIRVARTPGIADAITRVLPDVTVEEVDIPGPPTSATIRAAGWAEAEVLRLALTPVDDDGWVGPVCTADGGAASARIHPDGTVGIRVDAGEVLDEVVLRSYVVGAAHQALSWVSSESLSIDDDGEIGDLTIRSFGILRAVDTPAIEVEVAPSDGPPVAASDAAFVAVAAAIWHHQGRPPSWPTQIPVRPT